MKIIKNYQYHQLPYIRKQNQRCWEGESGKFLNTRTRSENSTDRNMREKFLELRSVEERFEKLRYNGILTRGTFRTFRY